METVLVHNSKTIKNCFRKIFPYKIYRSLSETPLDATIKFSHDENLYEERKLIVQKTRLVEVAY